MDFEFTDEQLGLRDNARAVLASSCPPSVVRSVYDGERRGGELWSALVALDWPAIGIAEEHGGLGLGFLEVGIVVEELGRVAAPTPFLATVTQLAPMLREAGAPALLPRIADGSCTGSLAIAEARPLAARCRRHHSPARRARLGARWREDARRRRRHG